MAINPMAFCPRCNFEIEQSAIECSRCHADFTKPGGWHSLAKNQYEPVPHPPLCQTYWTPKRLALFVLFIAWLVIYLVYLRPTVFAYLSSSPSLRWVQWLLRNSDEIGATIEVIMIVMLPVWILCGLARPAKKNKHRSEIDGGLGG